MKVSNRKQVIKQDDYFIRLILKFIEYKIMRTRNKKIVLVQSLNTYQTPKESKFIQHQDQAIPMRIYRQETDNEGHLAEIFYEALMNQTLNKRHPPEIQTYRSIKSTTLQTDSSQQKLKMGKIVRRSLSKNDSKLSSPEKPITTNLLLSSFSSKQETPKTGQLKRIASFRDNKENSKIDTSSGKTPRTSRRTLSNKKQIKYKVNPNPKV